MREIVSIHVGGAGVRIGNAMWKQLVAEEGIGSEGRKQTVLPDIIYSTEVLFHERHERVLFPRAIFADTDTESIADAQKVWGNYCFPQQFFAETSGPFARQHLPLRIEAFMDDVRILAEACQGLEGFLLTHSVDGRTGSGWVSLLQEQLQAEYPKRGRLHLVTYPTEASFATSSVLCRSLLGTKELLNESDFSILLDNEVFRRLCPRTPNDWTSVNTLIARLIANITASWRYSGCLNHNLANLYCDTIAYPRLNLLVPFFAPLDCKQVLSTLELTKSALDPCCSLARVDLPSGLYTAFCLTYKGDIIPRDVPGQYISTNRQLHHAVNVPTGCRFGINYPQSVYEEAGIVHKIPRTLHGLGNNTSIAMLYKQLNAKFHAIHKLPYLNCIYEQEGLQEDDLITAQEHLTDVSHEYASIQ